MFSCFEWFMTIFCLSPSVFMLGKQKQGIRTGELTQQKLLVSRFGGQKIKVPCLRPSDSGFVAIFGIPFLLHHPDLCLHFHGVFSPRTCVCLNFPLSKDTSHIGLGPTYVSHFNLITSIMLLSPNKLTFWSNLGQDLNIWVLGNLGKARTIWRKT